MTEAFSEQQILVLLSKADSAAFSFLYKKYYNMVRNLVLQNSGNEDDAADLFQEVLIIIYEKCRDKKLLLNCTLKTYVYSVSRNQWLKRLRTLNKTVKVRNFEEFIYVEEEEFTFQPDLKSLINEIGDACRKLLILFYYRKRSMEEISVELNYSNADTAKNQKYKCIQRLKNLISENKNGTKS